VGGSLGGLLAGIMLEWIGCDVTVHERVAEPLAERGAGIATHPELHEAFERVGIPIDDGFGVRIEERLMLGRDGQVLATFHKRQILATWGHLYRVLHRAFPREHYVAGSAFVRAEPSGAGVHAHFADGSMTDADLLVSADGIRSTVRAQFWPHCLPRYAGYVAWRGVAEEVRLSPETHRTLFVRFVVRQPPREHMVGCPVAALDRDLTPGSRGSNFVWYRLADDEKLRRMMTDSTGRYHAGGIPPFLIAPEHVEEIRRAGAASWRRAS